MIVEVPRCKRLSAIRIVLVWPAAHWNVRLKSDFFSDFNWPTRAGQNFTRPRCQIEARFPYTMERSGAISCRPIRMNSVAGEGVVFEVRRHRDGCGDRAHLRHGVADPLAVLTKVHATLVRRQEVQEPLVVLRRHPEQSQQTTVVAPCGCETSPNQCPDVVSRDVAR